MEGTPHCLRLHTWAGHRTQLLQGAILPGHFFTLGIVHTYSGASDRAIVDHTGEAADLDSLPTVSTLGEERILSGSPK